MTLRVASLIYATDSGLGLLAKAFVDHGVITHPIVVRHGRHPTHDEWHPDAPQITDLNNPAQRDMASRHCAGCDVLLMLETPHIWSLIPHCRSKGVKTVLCPMYECEKANLEYQPDFFICPSLLDQQYYPDRSIFLPVPVEVPWRQRTRAEVFVHNAGHGGLKGRNGTAEVLEAMEHIKSPAKLIVRSQESLYRTAGHRQHAQLTNPLIRRGQKIDYDDENAPRPERMAEFREGTMPYEQLWSEGDVFLFPEKFNGLSLPLQEARAAGMLVMCGARFPMTTWLPNEPLIPVKGYRKNKIGPPYNEFSEAIFDPKHIAATVDGWYGADLTAYSLEGKAWAETMSWNALRPRYLQTLEALCAS